MSILCACEAPPPEGWVSVGEYEARFVARPAGAPDRSSHMRTRRPHGLSPPGVKVAYPDISVESEPRGDHVTQSESLFLPTQEHPWKKAWNTLWDHGLMQSLEGLEEDTEGTVQEGLAARLALSILYYVRTAQGLYEHMWGESKVTARETAAKYSRLSDWEEAIVRAISLHPRLPYIAIARQDDRIEVRSLQEADHRVLLRDKKQVGVVCLQWAPHCDQLLAVGATKGILLWHMDPTAPCSRFLTTWVRVESSPGHAPISSLSWSPQGNFLVSASPADSNLIVWNVPMGVATKVQRSRGGGVTEVSWSPDGGRVYAGSLSAMFRVWETLKWSCEKWTNSTGRCKAACWSPKGDILLFALEGDPSLYYICFRGNELAAGSSNAIKCADLTPCTLVGEGGEEFVVGGCIQNMCWDETGERLAIVFTADSPCVDLVAVLRTRTSHLLDILPGGFIRGQEGEVPLTASFKPGYAEGALLTTVWSSGRISFTPLCFQSPLSLTTPTFSPEQLRPLTSLQPSPPLTRKGLGTPIRTHQTTLYSTELDSD